MKNILEIDGHRAVINFDPDMKMFRGEFLDLNGGADFYAADVAGLENEGRVSLRTFMEVCAEKGIEPMRKFSGRFNLRLDPATHQAAVVAAAAENKSLNEWAAGVISEAAGVNDNEAPAYHYQKA